jgi:hypothetical protein
MDVSLRWSGPPRTAKRKLDDAQRVTAPPHAGLMRERLVVLVNGVPHVVEVVRQPRHLGGTQAYWCCPQCSALRSDLFVVDGVLLCRVCHRLDYRSRHVPRAVHRAAKLRRKLGAEPGLLSPIPKRPRNRWAAARYDRLVRELRAVENVLAGALSATVQAIKRRAEREKL